ncbi:MAG: DegT/DnrJ/EryC1/StrS family aminotransferase [Pseudomonadota bacterium]
MSTPINTLGPRRVIPLNANSLTSEEINAAKAVLDSGFLTMGRKVTEFESVFANYIGAKHAIMVNSGSSANLIAAFALADGFLKTGSGKRRIQPGDEVIVPALTWSTTVWPFVQAGAVPVFVDCDPATLQVPPEAIENAITDKTRAIVVVHVLGGAVNIPAIRAIAEKHGLWLFEDTCESLGVTWNGQQVGTFGDMGSYSFYFAHHITTIEGGMVVTQDDDLADLLRAQRSHGWVRHMSAGAHHAAETPEIDPRFLFVTTGFNVRPTEINAAIGLVQLSKLDQFNDRRRAVGLRHDQMLHRLIQRGDLSVMSFDAQCAPAPFGYPVICRSREDRNALQSHLEAHGIETRPVICGNLARQPAMKHITHRISETLSGCDTVMDRGLYWGTHPLMTDEDVDYVVAQVEAFFK